jgi:hypothetical protein
MANHTDSTHPDYNQLISAKQKMKIVGEFVNEQQKQYEALHKVVEISHKFNDLPVCSEREREAAYASTLKGATASLGAGTITSKVDPRR